MKSYYRMSGRKGGGSRHGGTGILGILLSTFFLFLLQPSSPKTQSRNTTPKGYTATNWIATYEEPQWIKEITKGR